MPGRRKKLRMVILYIIGFILITWTIATFYVEQEGVSYVNEIGVDRSEKTALIIFDPDPIYNLDEQVCNSIGEGLVDNSWFVKVVSVKEAHFYTHTDYDLIVFCANTYNWAPDRILMSFIDNETFYLGKKVAAVVVGSGSTTRARKKIQSFLSEKDCELIDTKEFWLMKPNDEEDMDRPNTELANELAMKWGDSLAKMVLQ